MVKEARFGVLRLGAVDVFHEVDVGERDLVGADADDWAICAMPFRNLIIALQTKVVVGKVETCEFAPNGARDVGEGVEVEGIEYEVIYGSYTHDNGEGKKGVGENGVGEVVEEHFENGWS